MSPRFPFGNDVVVRRLEAPPEAGFDCGRAEQTSYLYERAWADQNAGLSVTYLYYAKGILAGYATLCMDAIPLSARERDPTVRYQEAAALKLAQLGVAVGFQGMGLGGLILGDVLNLAREEAERVGCRFVSLDSQPDVVGWYEAHGFVRNKLRQERRIQDAITRGRDPSVIPVSMRYDIRPVGRST